MRVAKLIAFCTQEMSGTSNVQINASQKKKKKENITSMIFYSSKSDTDGEPDNKRKKLSFNSLLTSMFAVLLCPTQSQNQGAIK
jgi:hypothetical protein